MERHLYYHFFYISKEVTDKILIVVGVILVIIAIYVLEKETHFISNSVIATKNMIEDVTTDIHDLIKTYFSELLTKNDYQNQREDHHIVAKSDYRAWFSRMILAECGIGLNDGINLVSVKKTYHKVCIQIFIIGY